MASKATQSATTKYVTAGNGVRFAYRFLNPSNSSNKPLVMHIHYRSNMDFWDPLLVNALSAARPVLIFDQAGIGRSSGEVPTTMQGWADDLIALVDALEFKAIDLLGFSMGGMAVQMVALTRPELVKKLILAGTSPSLPSAAHVAGVVWPRENASEGEAILRLSTAVSEDDGRRALQFSFFYDDADGRAAFDAYWDRLHTRAVPVPGEELNLKLLDVDGGAKRQWESMKAWHFSPNPKQSFDRLGELKMPVLVMNGDDDLLIPTSRSWELLRQIKDAKLIIYPLSGHGFIWQYAVDVAHDINRFLDTASK